MSHGSILAALVATLCWGYVIALNQRRALGMISPSSLIGIGIILMYTLAVLYWSIRPWVATEDPHWGGIGMVMISAIVFAIPFIILELSFSRDSKQVRKRKVNLQYGAGLWLMAMPAIYGLFYRIALFGYGYQGRNEKIDVDLFGSVEISYLLSYLIATIAAFYFILILCGNRQQKLLGYLLWVIDGLVCVFSLHRFELLAFGLRSGIFLTLQKYRVSAKQKIYGVLFLVFVIGVYGNLWTEGFEESQAGFLYQTPGRIMQSSKNLLASGKISFGNVIDEVFSRLYMARSASAIIEGVPEIIPYCYGESLLHALYAPIPRYLWKGKPDLVDVHLWTQKVMPEEYSLSPTGSLAELYVNGWLIGVFFGGLFLAVLARLHEKVILKDGLAGIAARVTYPLFALYYVWADANYSQRLAEFVRLLLVAIVIFGVLKISCSTIYTKSVRKNWNFGKRFDP